MTQCKIDHARDADAIPLALCRVCTPRATKGPTRDLGAEQSRFEANEAMADKLAKRNKRKLRASVKEWRERIELMQKYGKDTKKAEEALRVAEHALYLVA